MKIQLTARRDKSNTAWSKAPNDAAMIASRLGYEEFDIDTFRIIRSSIWGRILNKLHLTRIVESFLFLIAFHYLCFRFKLHHGGALFIQHPIPGIISADELRIRCLERLKKLGVFISILVHDVGVLRGQSAAVGGKCDEKKEKMVFSLADSLIVHNEKMKDWFVSQGFTPNKVIVLGMFDYLVNECSNEREVNPSVLQHPRIAIAGGMSPDKAKYCEYLGTITDVSWRLYGTGFDPNRIHGSTLEYCGCFPPDIIPSQIDADFGLVWDGESIDACSGETGKYLLYNNPHKMSLYLASGLPVIVWNQSAVAQFVNQRGIGIAVSSPREIGRILSKMANEEYVEMKRNVMTVMESVWKGEFLSHALKQSIH